MSAIQRGMISGGSWWRAPAQGFRMGEVRLEITETGARLTEVVGLGEERALSASLEGFLAGALNGEVLQRMGLGPLGEALALAASLCPEAAPSPEPSSPLAETSAAPPQAADHYVFLERYGARKIATIKAVYQSELLGGLKEAKVAVERAPVTFGPFERAPAAQLARALKEAGAEAQALTLEEAKAPSMFIYLSDYGASKISVIKVFRDFGRPRLGLKEAKEAVEAKRPTAGPLSAFEAEEMAQALRDAGAILEA